MLLRYGKSFPGNTKGKGMNYTVDKGFMVFRIISLVISVLLLGIILFRPSGLVSDPFGGTEGMDCIWLLDVSASMDVTDISENTVSVSRLARAKSMIENYIITHPENRY